MVAPATFATHHYHRCHSHECHHHRPVLWLVPLLTAVRPAVYRRRRLAALLSVAVSLVVAVAAIHAVADRLGGSRPLGVPEAIVETTGVGPALAGAFSEPAPARDAPAVYIVQPGDTLWTVARRLKPGGDVRPVVDQLAAANGGAALVVGQVLVLPRD